MEDFVLCEIMLMFRVTVLLHYLTSTELTWSCPTLIHFLLDSVEKQAKITILPLP